MATRILIGDVRERLAELPDESVQCVVTSPPYFGLRDYGTAAWSGGDPACDHVARATCDCDAGTVPCVVLDPFGGSGTTGLVADQLERECILIELNPIYAELARKRIHGASPMFAEVNVL